MNQHIPKVSVIMAVYNTEYFIGEAIESILYQSFGEFEFVIIDDASTDASYEICQMYAQKDSRIQLYRNEKNKGISATRNMLLAYTRGMYIAVQDSDDVSELDRLEKEYNFLNVHPKYAVVSGNNRIINEDGNLIGLRMYKDSFGQECLRKNPISQPSVMFRKDIFKVVGGYDCTLNYGEDYDLWLKIYAAGYQIKNLSETLLSYRLRKGQTKSLQLKQTLKNTILIQQRAIKDYGYIPSMVDKVYILIEKIVLLFPSKWILFVFTKITYHTGSKV